MILVYIIKTHYNTHYCGITNNLIRRWKEHSTGKSSYLRYKKPHSVVHIEYFENRKLAAKREKIIKRIGVSKFVLIRKINHE